MEKRLPVEPFRRSSMTFSGVWRGTAWRFGRRSFVHERERTWSCSGNLSSRVTSTGASTATKPRLRNRPPSTKISGTTSMFVSTVFGARRTVNNASPKRSNQPFASAVERWPSKALKHRRPMPNSPRIPTPTPPSKAKPSPGPRTSRAPSTGPSCPNSPLECSRSTHLLGRAAPVRGLAFSANSTSNSSLTAR